MKENNETIVVSTEVVEAQEKASYDIQIATAKMYPRNVRKSLDNALTIATMDKKTAGTCGYALPRGNTKVKGPSVHLARILIQTWGNVRVESRVIDITHTQIVSQAVCFDLESNVATKVEVRRSIMGKHGRYNEDMITMTGNACNAIAYRNAVFATIPSSVVDSVYQATLDVVTGGLSEKEGDKDKNEALASVRSQWVEYFRKKFKATDDEICFCTGKKTIEAIGKEEISILAGVNQAIKDNDTTVEFALGRDKKTVPEKREQMKANKQTKVDLP